MSATSRQRGFLLADLLLAASLVAVAASLMAASLIWLYDAHSRLRSHEALAGNADQALRRMARDIRRGVPLSARVNAAGTAIELMHIADAGRYRALDGSNPGGTVHSGDAMAIGSASSGFNLTGRLHNLAFAYASTLASGHRLVIAPTSAASLWAALASGSSPGVASPQASGISVSDDGDEDRLLLSASHSFSTASSAQRVYLSDGPVQLRCTASGELLRHAGYSPSASMAVPPSGGSSALLAQGVSGCSFAVIEASNPEPHQLARLSLTLTGERGEALTLLHQVRVLNRP